MWLSYHTTQYLGHRSRVSMTLRVVQDAVMDKGQRHAGCLGNIT